MTNVLVERELDADVTTGDARPVEKVVVLPFDSTLRATEEPHEPERRSDTHAHEEAFCYMAPLDRPKRVLHRTISRRWSASTGT